MLQYLHADILDINIVTYLYHASRAPHARARLYYNFISSSRDVIVIYFLYFAMHFSLKCIICAPWYRRYPRE